MGRVSFLLFRIAFPTAICEGSAVLRKHTHPRKSPANNTLLIQFAASVLGFVGGVKVEFHFHFRALIQL